MVVGSWKEVVKEICVPKPVQKNEISNQPGIEKKLTFDDLLNLRGKDLSDLEAFSLKKITKKALARVEKEVILHVLDRTKWNRTVAAKILKISYKTLLYKINDLKIEPPGNMK